MTELKLDEILSKLESFKKLESLEKKIDDIKNSIKEDIKEQDIKIRKIENKLNEERRRNIIIFGIKSKTWIDIQQEIQEIIKSIVEDFRKYDIIKIKTINNPERMMFLVTLSSYLLRNDILKRKKELTGKYNYVQIKQTITKRHSRN